MGFIITSPENKLRWWEYLTWKNGGSVLEASKVLQRKMNDILDIDNAMFEKQRREIKVRELMNKVRFG